MSLLEADFAPPAAVLALHQPPSPFNTVVIKAAVPGSAITHYTVNEEYKISSQGSWMQYIRCSQNCSKSSRSVLGREGSLSNKGTMRFLQRVLTSRVRMVKNHNFFLLFQLADNASSRVEVLSTNHSMLNNYLQGKTVSLTTLAYCSPSGSGYKASYLQGPSESPTKARTLEGCQKQLFTTETNSNPSSLLRWCNAARIVTDNNGDNGRICCLTKSLTPPPSPESKEASPTPTPLSSLMQSQHH